MRSSVDVAVIGGGIVGVATAAHLAEAGATVALFEGASLGAGASGRNSGVVQHPSDRALVPLYEESLALYRRLAEADSSFALPAEPAGLLHVTDDPAVARALADEIARDEPGIRPAFLDVGVPARLDPAIAPGIAACRVEVGYPVGPRAATEAYAAFARRAGADLRIGAPARLRVSAERAVGVDLDGSFVPASAVVVAAGPWTPAVLDRSGGWRPIVPVWGLVADVTLDMPPRHVLEEVEVEARIGEGPATGEGEEHGIAFSLVTASGRSSLGSTFLAAEPDPARLVPALRSRGARFVPALAASAVACVRVCARPASIDGRPLVGALPSLPGLFVAAGHGAWGISTGPATGRLVADLVLGRLAAVPPELDVARFRAP